MRVFRTQPRERRNPKIVAQAICADTLWISFYQVTRQQRPNQILSSSGERAQQFVIEPAQERAQRKEVGRHFWLLHAGILTDNRVFHRSGGLVWTQPRSA